MRAQFLSDSSDFRSRGGGSYSAKGRRDDSLFWWTILITLLIGVATFCWFFSIMVFKYPEKPFNYKLLVKLEKLDPLAKFDPLAAVAMKLPDGTPVQRLPNGTFHNARDLLNKYYNYNPDQLRLTNALLKRSYIMNYSGEAPVYVKGTYSVTSVRPLAAEDMVQNGWVVRARSVDLEDVEIELLLPVRAKVAAKTAEEAPIEEEVAKAEPVESVAAAEKAEPAKDEVPKAVPVAVAVAVVDVPYSVGEVFTLDNKKSFCSVINILRNQDADGLCATVVPISYGTFDLGNQKAIALGPPTSLKVDAPLPVTGTDPSPPADSKVAAQQTGVGTAP